MPVSEYITCVLGKIFDVCDAELHPMEPNLRAQNILSLSRQLRDRVPHWFLQEYLETMRNPEQTVEDAVRAFRETTRPFRAVTMPADTLRKCILGGATPQVAHALVEEIFGPLVSGDPSIPPRLKFVDDISALYSFLRQKTVEEAIKEEENRQSESAQEGGALDSAKGDSNGEVIRVTLRDEEKATLIQNCSDSIFSIYRLIRKLATKQTSPGYL